MKSGTNTSDHTMSEIMLDVKCNGSHETGRFMQNVSVIIVTTNTRKHIKTQQQPRMHGRNPHDQYYTPRHARDR